MVLISHSTKGSTTGCFYGERTESLAEFAAASISTERASFEGGETPIDDLNLEDQVNARYWNDKSFHQTLRQTRRFADVEASNYGAIFFVGGQDTISPSA